MPLRRSIRPLNGYLRPALDWRFLFALQWRTRYRQSLGAVSQGDSMDVAGKPRCTAVQCQDRDTCQTLPAGVRGRPHPKTPGQDRSWNGGIDPGVAIPSIPYRVERLPGSAAIWTIDDGAFF